MDPSCAPVENLMADKLRADFFFSKKSLFEHHVCGTNDL